MIYSDFCDQINSILKSGGFYNDDASYIRSLLSSSDVYNVYGKIDLDFLNEYSHITPYIGDYSTFELPTYNLLLDIDIDLKVGDTTAQMQPIVQINYLKDDLLQLITYRRNDKGIGLYPLYLLISLDKTFNEREANELYGLVPEDMNNMYNKYCSEVKDLSNVMYIEFLEVLNLVDITTYISTIATFVNIILKYFNTSSENFNITKIHTSKMNIQ